MSSAKPRIKRTYGTRPTRPTFALSGSSDASSSPPRESYVASTSPAKRKRPLSELFLPNNAPPVKKRHLIGKPATKKTALTQLHFITDAPILRTCSSCDLTYTRGAPDDEALHKAHCARVQKGLEWGRDDEREMIKANVVEVQSRVKLKSGEMGRIVSVSAICGGKIGQKISTYLRTINTVLSAPSMTDEALKASKAYIFLLPSAGGTRETIVGCAVAQHIENAMAVADPDVSPSEELLSPSSSNANLVLVDGSLYCNPEKLPTPVGIPRLFVGSMYRRKGVAEALLNTVCTNFIHGCRIDPTKGELAFSQPTRLGRAVMEKCGKGGIRVFEE